MTPKKFGLPLLLVLVGAAISFVLLTPRAERVIQASFTLSPGGRYGPYDDDRHPNGNRTYLHTRLFVKSTLKGEVAVEGGTILLTMRGSNVERIGGSQTHGPSAVSIDGRYDFTIRPAHDQYSFMFQNVGSAQSRVGFTVTEIWHYTPVTACVWLAAALMFLFLRPTGLVIVALALAVMAILVSFRSRRQRGAAAN